MTMTVALLLWHWQSHWYGHLQFHWQSNWQSKSLNDHISFTISLTVSLLIPLSLSHCHSHLQSHCQSHTAIVTNSLTDNITVIVTLSHSQWQSADIWSECSLRRHMCTAAQKLYNLHQSLHQPAHFALYTVYTVNISYTVPSIFTVNLIYNQLSSIVLSQKMHFTLNFRLKSKEYTILLMQMQQCEKFHIGSTIRGF